MIHTHFVVSCVNMDEDGSFESATKSALKATSNTLPDWLSRMKEDSYDRNKKLLAKEGRTALWQMCSRLGVDVNGVPGLACRLVESYLSKQLCNFLKRQRDSAEWLLFKQSLLTHLPLTMMSCVQLSSKMNGTPFHITAGIAKIYLTFKGFKFTVADVKKSELEVFFILDNYIPKFTYVEIGHILATEVGMPKEMMPGISIIVDSAEFRLNDVLKEMLHIVDNLPFVERKDYLGTLSALHLVASSVIASAQFLRFESSDPVPQLAHLTNAPIPFLRCVSNIIYTLTVLDDKSNISSNKRKYPN